MSTASVLLSQRRPFRPIVRTRKQARLFDRYVQSRNRYKAELLHGLASGVSVGPVLELNDGFGSIGMELLKQGRFVLHVICGSRHGRHTVNRKLAGGALAERCRVWECDVPPFPFSGELFELIYSVNTLHEWKDPVSLLRAAWELLRPDGSIVVNDLKRDSDPFITEYVIREMAEDTSEEGQFRLMVFLRALESAYTSEEIETLLRDSGLTSLSVDDDEPMTLTVHIEKRR